MKAFLALGVLALSSALTIEQQFVEWKATFGRKYTGVEHDRRLANFRSNALRVAALNAESAHRPSGAVFKLNKFADWDQKELSRLRGIKGLKASLRNATITEAAPKIAAPDSVDWRTKGVLAPIQDQGQCGSCWAFSATATLESQKAIASGNAPAKLSEQFLVDCDHQCGQYREENGCDAGCDGGLQPNAWVFTKKAGGQPSESAYPYQGVDGTCQSGNPPITTLTGWAFAPSDETGIAAYVASNGPVSIAVNAENWSFYQGGIMSGGSICPTVSDPWNTLDHGVNIVGYGTSSDGTPFWIIRNSWNADWGENGYCRLIRGQNYCGINLFACRALV